MNMANGITGDWGELKRGLWKSHSNTLNFAGTETSNRPKSIHSGRNASHQNTRNWAQSVPVPLSFYRLSSITITSSGPWGGVTVSRLLSAHWLLVNNRAARGLINIQTEAWPSAVGGAKRGIPVTVIRRSWLKDNPISIFSVRCLTAWPTC